MGQNMTNSNSTADENHRLEEIVPDIVLMSVYLIVGVVGNICILVIYSEEDQQKTKSYKIFIFILAIVDFISCVMNCFLNIVLVAEPPFLGKPAICKILRFSCHVVAVTSAFILGIIALQRYMFICRPFTKPMTPFIRTISVSVCIVLSLLLCFPVLIFYGSSELDSGRSVAPLCGILNEYIGSKELLAYNIVFSAFTVIVLGGISVLYFVILKTVYHKKKKTGKNHTVKYVSRSNTSADSSKAAVINYSMLSLNNRLYDSTTSLAKRKARLSFRQHMLTMMFLTVTVFCIVSFVPRRIIEFAEAVEQDVVTNSFGKHQFGYRFVKTLYILNNVVNPYIYGLFDRDLRRKLYKMFRRCTNYN